MADIRALLRAERAKRALPVHERGRERVGPKSGPVPRKRDAQSAEIDVPLASSSSSSSSSSPPPQSFSSGVPTAAKRIRDECSAAVLHSQAANGNDNEDNGTVTVPDSYTHTPSQANDTINEAEWAAFERDMAETLEMHHTSSQASESVHAPDNTDADDREIAMEHTLHELSVMEALGERVQRMRQRRQAVLNIIATSTPVDAPVPGILQSTSTLNASDSGGDDEDGEDDVDEDDNDNWLSVRTSCVRA